MICDETTAKKRPIFFVGFLKRMNLVRFSNGGLNVSKMKRKLFINSLVSEDVAPRGFFLCNGCVVTDVFFGVLRIF